MWHFRAGKIFLLAGSLSLRKSYKIVSLNIKIVSATVRDGVVCKKEVETEALKRMRASPSPQPPHLSPNPQLPPAPPHPLPNPHSTPIYTLSPNLYPLTPPHPFLLIFPLP